MQFVAQSINGHPYDREMKRMAPNHGLRHDLTRVADQKTQQRELGGMGGEIQSDAGNGNFQWNRLMGEPKNYRHVSEDCAPGDKR